MQSNRKVSSGSSSNRCEWTIRQSRGVLTVEVVVSVTRRRRSREERTMISVDCRREAISQPPDRADSEDFVNRGSLIGPISILLGDCQIVTVRRVCGNSWRLKKEELTPSEQ